MPRDDQRTPKWQVQLLGALALALVVSLTLMVRNHNANDPEASSAPLTPVRTRGAGDPPQLQKLPPKPQVVVIGDSWAAGYGAEVPEAQNWASVASSRLGWSLNKFALGGAAYISQGTYADYKGNFRYCLKMARDRAPDPRAVDLVVIQGGINDTDYRLKPGPLTDAFAATVETAKQLFPKAQLLVMGPMAPTDPYEGSVNQVDAILAAAAYSLRVPYVSTYELGWLSQVKRPGLVNEKIVHPNTKGYASIGADFTKYVQQSSR